MTRDEFILQAYLAAIASGRDMADSEHIADESADFYERIKEEEQPETFWRTFETPPTFDDELDGYVLFKPCAQHKDDHPVELFHYNAFDESLNCPDCRWARIPK